MAYADPKEPDLGLGVWGLGFGIVGWGFVGSGAHLMSISREMSVYSSRVSVPNTCFTIRTTTLASGNDVS